jgi:hypothetical protein
MLFKIDALRAFMTSFLHELQRAELEVAEELEDNSL